jgi:hypothetical protein
MAADEHGLSHGRHATPPDGMCAMEWVSYLAGEPHGDQPACVSPVLRAFCTTLNDGLQRAQRQRLLPYLTRAIGTAGDGLDTARSWAAMDWLVRTYATRWVAAAGLSGAARSLASLPTLTNSADLWSAVAALKAARRDTRAAWAETLGSARLVALAPWAAGRVAAREAAWRSVGLATWAAARPTIGSAGVGDYARADWLRALTREVAGGAAAAALARKPHAGSDRTAAQDAAGRGLAAIIKGLEDSVFELLELMLAPDLHTSLAWRDPTPVLSAPG